MRADETQRSSHKRMVAENKSSSESDETHQNEWFQQENTHGNSDGKK